MNLQKMSSIMELNKKHNLRNRTISNNSSEKKK